MARDTVRFENRKNMSLEIRRRFSGYCECEQYQHHSGDNVTAEFLSLFHGFAYRRSLDITIPENVSEPLPSTGNWQSSRWKPVGIERKQA
jgi:hypothetical protein